MRAGSGVAGRESVGLGLSGYIIYEVKEQKGG